MILSDADMRSSHAGQRVTTFPHLISVRRLREVSMRTRKANHHGIIPLTFTA